jgi:hypothetical protein
MNLATGLTALALSLLIAAPPATTAPVAAQNATAVGDIAAPLESGRMMVAEALTRVVPGDVRNVRIVSWKVMPVAPLTQAVLGRAMLDAGGSVPIEVAFRANLDLDRGQVMQLSYRMVESRRRDAAPVVVDEVLRGRIGGELVAQFPGQPMDFHIVGITRSTHTATHLVIEGEGLSEFFAEGQARTPFVATFAIPSAQLVKLDYDLVAIPAAGEPLAAR